MPKFKIFLSVILIILFSSVFASGAFAQNTNPLEATSSPQPRNRLQLLGKNSPQVRIYRRLELRLSALLKRMEKINQRIKSRLAKLDIRTTDLNRLNISLENINKKLVKIEEDSENLKSAWSIYENSSEIAQFNQFKREALSLFDSFEDLIESQKELVAGLKSYKIKSQPVATGSSEVIDFN